MTRRPRLVLPDTPLHIIQRGNNRSRCFFVDADYLLYLELLREYANEEGCDVHAYVLMTNHVHLLVSPSNAQAPGALMQRLGQRYVQYINRRHLRTGTLWEGRYRSCLVGDEQYLLICQRYIELNPVRAGMVDDPGRYRWSSYRTNALGQPSELVQPHRVYAALAQQDDARRAVYQDLFREALADEMLQSIRFASNGNFALGNQEFTESAAKALGRHVLPGAGGRPRKNADKNCRKTVL